MAKEASLRICKASVELLTERENLDLIEPAIRGGVTSVYENRRVIAKNQYFPNYNSTEGHQFGFCADANNLYGEVMQLEIFPLSEFAFNTEITIQEVLDAPDNASVGCFLEGDPFFPPGLHDDHRDFPWPLPRKSLERNGWENANLT